MLKLSNACTQVLLVWGPECISAIFWKTIFIHLQTWLNFALAASLSLALNTTFFLFQSSHKYYFTCLPRVTGGAPTEEGYRRHIGELYVKVRLRV